MNVDNVRHHLVLKFLRTKHTLGDINIAAHAMVTTSGAADPSLELALLLDVALGYLNAALSPSGDVAAIIDGLETDLETAEIFKEIADAYDSPSAEMEGQSP